MRNENQPNSVQHANQYLLTTYTVDGQVPGSPTSPEEWQGFMERVSALEAEMDATGAFVFGGALYGPDKASVALQNGNKIVRTAGPYTESNKQVAGFYIINAEDLESALLWADKVVEATNHPIEILPFRATGKLKDNM